MSTKKKHRHRGVNLTTQGYQKLQQGIMVSANKNKWGERYTIQELSDLTRLSFGTINKVLNHNGAVDKSTLLSFFHAFDLELLQGDYVKFQLKVDEKLKCNLQNNYQDWELAVDVSDFYGQEENIATLTDWIVEKRCRLIMLLGMGGVGKTYLSIKVAQLIQNQFDVIIWRSLQEEISSQEIIDEWVSILSKKKKTNCSQKELINYLREHKSLLILDGLETLLESKNHQGKYQKNYQSYNRFLQNLGKISHESCVIITSREIPNQMDLLEEKESKIRFLYIKGEGCDLIKKNFSSKSNFKDFKKKLDFICDYYGNNYLLLKSIIKYINQLFDDELENFIAQEIRLFNDIYFFIHEHFERLSPLEIMIINQFKDEEKPLNLNIFQKKTKVFLTQNYGKVYNL